MPWAGEYEELVEYLRYFTNIGGDPPDDTGGILILLLALVDNLREGTFDEELQEYAVHVTEEQEAFLRKLTERALKARVADS